MTWLECLMPGTKSRPPYFGAIFNSFSISSCEGGKAVVAPSPSGILIS